MRKILFLASWYPSRVDPFNGDFIERHANCISLSNQVYVIYVVKDPFLKNGKWEIDKKVAPNLITYTGYYSPHKSGYLEKFYSNLQYRKLHKKIFKLMRDEYGIPGVVHLNVMMKAGIFALWLKKKYKLPYLLTEHWTGFSTERKDNYEHKSFLYKYFSRRIFRQCDWLLPVTEDLAKKMTQLFGQKKFTAIPNVVDTELFYIDPNKNRDKIKFIHVSSLGYHKNIWGILHAIEKLSGQRNDFELHLIGPASKEIIDWATMRGLLNKCIFFTGMIPLEKVAENMRKSDSLLMFSRYENLPCVILEALCCGLPVISTNVGGITEVINDDNGILIPSENEDELLKAMEFMITNMHQFNPEKIALNAKNKYNYHKVGQQFNEIYSQVIAENKTKKNFV